MQNISSDLYHLGIVEVMSVYKYRDLETDRRALDLKRNTYFFILRVSRVRLDACDRDFIFSHRGITYAVANCNEKPQPESGGTGAGSSIFRTATRQSSHVTSHPGRMFNQPSVRNYFQRNWTDCRMLSKTAAQGSVPCVGKTTTKKALLPTSRGGGFLDSGSQLLWSGEYCARSSGSSRCAPLNRTK